MRTLKSTAFGAGAALVATSVVLAGCAAPTPGSDADSGEPSSETVAEAVALTAADLTAERVLAGNANSTTVRQDEWSIDDAVDVSLTGDTAAVASNASGVRVDGSTVTITGAGVYRLRGELAGQVVVDAPQDALVVLVLDGAAITSGDSAAIAVTSADDVAIHLESGSRNTVSDAASYAEGAEIDAAIYSDADLTISGDGALEVDGRGADGIVSKDDLAIIGGQIAVRASDDGLRGRDSLVVKGGTVHVDAAGDALKSTNDVDASRGYILVEDGVLDLRAGADALDAESDVVITGGTFTIEAGDDAVHAEVALVIDEGVIDIVSSVEGLEGRYLGIHGGTIDIVASDDGINAAGEGFGADDDATSGAESEPTDATADGSFPGGGIPRGDLPGGQFPGGELPEGFTFPDGMEFDGDIPLPPDGEFEFPDGQVPPGMPGGGPGGLPGGAEMFEDGGQLIVITGGELTIDTDGDGIDSNGSAEISGGIITVYGPASGPDAALDANGSFTVSGGRLVAIGSSVMAVSPGEDSPQGWISATVQGKAGSTGVLADADATVIAEFTAIKAFQSVVIAVPEIARDASYTLTIDGAATEVTAGVAPSGGMAMPGRR